MQALLSFCATCGDSPEVKKTELSGNIPIFISYSWSECSVNCMFIVLSSMDVVGGATAAGVTLGTLYNYSPLYGTSPPPFALIFMWDTQFMCEPTYWPIFINKKKHKKRKYIWFIFHLLFCLSDLFSYILPHPQQCYIVCDLHSAPLSPLYSKHSQSVRRAPSGVSLNFPFFNIIIFYPLLFS